MATKISNNRLPQFFMPYLPKAGGFAGLKIPHAFIEHLNGSPKKAELRSRKEKLWHVKIEYTDDGVFFMDGWKTFVRDNSIAYLDILVFKYDNDHGFDVRIFGISGWEKRASRGLIEYLEIVEMEEEKGEEVVEHDGVADDIVIDVEECNEEEEEAEEGDEKASDIAIDVDAIHGSGNKDGDEDNNEEEEDDDTEEKEESKATTMRSRKQISMKNIGGKNANDISSSELNKYVGNPYFVTKLREGRKDVLLVPKSVLKDFGFKLAENVTFRSEFGWEWPGKVVTWKDGRQWIKGWRAVCRCNNVGEEDLCICVFPQRGRVEKDAIEVHIVRGGGS